METGVESLLRDGRQLQIFTICGIVYNDIDMTVEKDRGFSNNFLSCFCRFGCVGLNGFEPRFAAAVDVLELLDNIIRLLTRACICDENRGSLTSEFTRDLCADA